MIKNMKKLHIITALITYLWLPCCRAANSSDMLSQQLIKAGDKYHDNNDYPKAIECYKKATILFKTNINQNRLILAQIYNNLGMTLLELKEYDQTELLYKEARRIRKQLLQQNPNDSFISEALGKSHHNVGILEMETNKLKEAIRSFEAALNTKWANNIGAKDTSYYLAETRKKLKKSPPVKEANKRRYCPYCYKIFRVPAELKIHLPIHTGKKDFKCPYCAKKFYANKYVKQHLYLHSGERPFQCSICKKGFVQKSKMKKHQYQAHQPKADASKIIYLLS